MGNENSKKKKLNRIVKTPSVYQLEACECGAASLSMILRYYGFYAPMEELREACGVSRDGSSAASLVMAADKYGLESHGYKKNAEQLKSFEFPCILFWNSNHFVVLEGFRGKKVYLNDPANGRRSISYEEFKRLYSGIVITFKPRSDFKKRKGSDGIVKFFAGRLSQEKSTVAFLIICGLLLTVPGILLPEFTQEYIDRILLNKQYAWFSQILFCIFFTYVYQIVYSFIRKHILNKLKLKLTVIYNNNLMNKLIKLPISFFEQRYAGELSGRLDNNDEVNAFLSGSFSDAVLNILEAVFFLVFLLRYNLKLSMVGIFGVIINAGLTLAMIEPLKNMSLKLKQDLGRQNAILTAGFSVATSIKANGVEDEYARETIDDFALTASSEQRIGASQQVLSAFPGAVNNIVNMMVLIVGGMLIIRGECSTGMLTGFLMLLGTFNQPINQLISISMELQNTRAGISRVLDVENAIGDSKFDIEKDSKEYGFEGYVEMKDVVFGYNSTLPPVVDGISFKIAPGSRIGIVGSSGCGKSTVARLVAGMVTPWSGEIKIDDIPIDKISHREITENVMVVNQNNTIFSGTVRDNLTMWRNDISDKDIRNAVVDAEAEELILSLPGEYESKLTEGGYNFSGGQRQKIEIARALIHNPAILVLDEATSSLDAITESKILNNLKKRNCTTITIAHRLSAVKDCEMILAMADGKIVECGSHEELLAKGGLYYSLANEGMQ